MRARLKTLTAAAVPPTTRLIFASWFKDPTVSPPGLGPEGAHREAHGVLTRRRLHLLQGHKDWLVAIIGLHLLPIEVPTFLPPAYFSGIPMSRALAPGRKTSVTSISGSSPGVAEKRIFGMLSV